MRACFITDPIDRLKPAKDSSIDLALEAMSRGYRVDVCAHHHISAGTDGVFARTTQLTLNENVRDQKKLDASNHALGPAERVNMQDYDAIFIRKDPPFDSDYLSLCLLLDPLCDVVAMVNSPRGLRIVSEKLSALLFRDAAPATLATYDKQEAAEFASRFPQVVLKPSFLGSGEGISISTASDSKFETYLDVILSSEPKGPVILQQFLPEVKAGDMRLMLLDGDILGALGRKPPEGDFRSNIAIGGKEFAVEISPKQREVALEIGAFLKGCGIVFAGLDFIGDHLIEINVTSPTLIQELRRVGGPDASKRIWDHIEKL